MAMIRGKMWIILMLILFCDSSKINNGISEKKYYNSYHYNKNKDRFYADNDSYSKNYLSHHPLYQVTHLHKPHARNKIKNNFLLINKKNKSSYTTKKEMIQQTNNFQNKKNVSKRQGIFFPKELSRALHLSVSELYTTLSSSNTAIQFIIINIVQVRTSLLCQHCQ